MKITRKKIIIGIVGFLSLLLFWGFLNISLQRTRASADLVNLTLTPKTGNVGISQNQIVNVLISAQNAKKISGIDLTFKTEGNLKITDVGAPQPVGTPVAAFSQIIKNITNTQARVVYVSSEPQTTLPQNINVPVTVQGTANGTAKLKIDSASSQIVGTTQDGVFSFGVVEEGQYTIGLITGPTITPTPTPTPAVVVDPVATLRFNPSQNTVGIGGASTTQFIITPAAPGRISGFQTTIKYPKNLISVTEVGDPYYILNDVVISPYVRIRKEVDTTLGEIRLSYVVQGAEATLPRNAYVSISYTAHTLGTGALEITDAQVTGNVEGYSYQPIIQNGQVTVTQAGPTPSITGGPSITPPVTPVGNVTLNLKLRFQGIIKAPPAGSTMRVQVKASSIAVGSSATGTGTFTADANGVWSGQVPLNLTPGVKYRVLVKGPKHLQKKICSPAPSETASGTYRCSDTAASIVLEEGVNTLDFSKVVLLVGDLPEQGAEGQNGVVDAYDVSFVRNNLGSKDPGALAVGDINLDGVIDTQDFSLILASLSVKYDEE